MGQMNVGRLAVVGLTAVAFAANAKADAISWNGDVAGGNWSESANWTAGHAPLAQETIYITNTVAASGHVVTADVSYVSTATNALVVGNAIGTATNTLVVKAGTELDFDRAIEAGNRWDVQVKKGGRIVMEDGSILRRRYGNYGEYNSIQSYSHYFIRLWEGGRFEQEGGYIGITDNARQGIRIGDTSGSVTSTWHMAGGVLYWNTSQMGSGNVLRIEKTGRFEMSGTAAFTNGCNNALYRPAAHCMKGGVFDMAGDSRLRAAHGNYHFFGWGDTIVRERARVTTDNNPWMYLGCLDDDPAGSVARLVVKDDATFTFGGNPTAYVGGRGGCHAVLDSSSTKSCTYGGAFLYVGFDAGTAEAWFRGPGYVKVGSYSGLHIGADSLKGTGSGVTASDCTRTSVETAAPTGTVYLTGGALDIGGHTSQAWAYNYLTGLVVGDGSRFPSALTDPFESRNYCGRFYMSGGSITNEGYLVVGAGRATGSFVQTDGTVVDNCGNAAPMVVGCAGGYGTYVLSNGTVTVKKSLFIGGATTNDLQRTGWTDPTKTQGGYPKGNNYPHDRHDAKGTFTVACADRAKACKLDVTETITLSSDGAGTLEVIGSGATVKAKNMVVSNQVAEVEGGASTVRFVADAEGLSPVTVSGNLTLAENVRLEVDMSAYAGKRNVKFKIFDCKTRTGAFAPDNVTLVNCRFVQDDGDPDIYVKAGEAQGLIILCR